VLRNVTTAYITHPACLRHETGSDHPESRQRLYAIEDALISAGLMNLLKRHDAPHATREQLCRVHAPEYLDEIERRVPLTGQVALDADTMMGPESLEAAYRAAGAVALGVDMVIRREVDTVFCGIRPPGHHAGRNSAMGFCIFNNVAVGAAHAMAEHGIERIAIVDFDVHHGNGTEDAFARDDSVFYLSTHRYPFYPGTGGPYTLGDPPVATRNLPLPAHTPPDRFHAAWEAGMAEVVEFAPELIVVSAGFDGHEDDPIAGLNLRVEDFARITETIVKAAERTAGGRIVSTLEGGYGLSALGACVEAHARALAD